MIFMFEADSLQFVYLNQGAIESMGYSREELLQMHPYDIKPLLDEAQFRAFIAPLMSGQQDVLHFETVHRHKEGRDFPVEIFLQLVQEDGTAGRFIAIVRDISERKRFEQRRRQAEAELASSENRLRAVIDTVVDGIVTIDAAGRVASFNPAAERIFGYPKAEVIGHNVNMLMPSPYAENHDGYLRNNFPGDPGPRSILNTDPGPAIGDSTQCPLDGISGCLGANRHRRRTLSWLSRRTT
jgi:PAS domain S-box-containing protein